jgi:predicted small lipoprotein YifL
VRRRQLEEQEGERAAHGGIMRFAAQIDATKKGSSAFRTFAAETAQRTRAAAMSRMESVALNHPHSEIIADDQTSLSAAGWGYVPGWTLRGYCGALAKVRDAVRIMVLLLMLAAVTACSRYDPVPPGGIVTCHTAQPSGEHQKGCG